MRLKTPKEVNLVGSGWTLKKIVQWVETSFSRSVSRNTVRNILKQNGLSWKKCKKLLAKANPEKRAAFIEQFQAMYQEMCAEKATIIYIDESHFHQDLDLGYSWSVKGKPHWIKSSSPGLSAKVNWYGAYNFATGRCFLWQRGNCNSEQTSAFLEALVNWLAVENQTIYVILDGAPWHRSHQVKMKAEKMNINLVQLPGYSPDLNPIEGLWKWMREEVTQLCCHANVQALKDDCLRFIDRINLEPDQVIKRLWPKFELDPDYEKLLFSN